MLLHSDVCHSKNVQCRFDCVGVDLNCTCCWLLNRQVFTLLFQNLLNFQQRCKPTTYSCLPYGTGLGQVGVTEGSQTPVFEVIGARIWQAHGEVLVTECFSGIQQPRVLLFQGCQHKNCAVRHENFCIGQVNGSKCTPECPMGWNHEKPGKLVAFSFHGILPKIHARDYLDEPNGGKIP